MEQLRVVERNLLLLVVLSAGVGLAVPAVGVALSGLVTPLLALLMLAVSLTFDLRALRHGLARPGTQALATVLVYGPMSLVAHAFGRLAFGAGPLGMGVTLVGVLPTDVSSPLLVYLARGNVALATVLNTVNTALAPFLVPALFVLYTGVELDVPTGVLVLELAGVVLLPTVVGVTIRTRFPRVGRVEPALSATGALAYVLLVLAVVGPNADRILENPLTVAGVAAVALALNAFGYLLGVATRPLLPDRRDRAAMLFTISKKEFSIAAFVVLASGLPAEVAVPAVVYAVVQMTTGPLAARWLTRGRAV